MLAFSSGEIINISKFATALDVSQPTIKKYFEIQKIKYVANYDLNWKSKQTK
jgi:hypothetical protein